MMNKLIDNDWFMYQLDGNPVVTWVDLNRGDRTFGGNMTDYCPVDENGKRFYDWIIVGCYYAIYHASLALLSTKGYSSKNHLATLCALIYLYYEGEITKEDIELIAESSIEKEEVTYFVEAKNKRETASYGISEEFSKNEAEKLRIKTIVFVNKVKEILE